MYSNLTTYWKHVQEACEDIVSEKQKTREERKIWSGYRSPVYPLLEA